MQVEEAISLINHDFQQTDKQIWADLGCGTGVFTLALANLLPSKSIIHAVDKKNYSLPNNAGRNNDVVISLHQADFVRDDLKFKDLDGILMANSIHYVRNKLTFIDRMEKLLRPGGIFLIVEYNRVIPSPWVPFPMTYEKARSLFEKKGSGSIEKLNEMPSRYGGKIYSMIVRKL